MADLDKIMKGLDSCIKQGRLGIDNCRELGCPYFENGLRLSCWIDVLTDALELLKQYSGLAKALEQSNAVNEHLNAEIERLKEMQQVDNCERCRFKDKCLTGRQLDR